jgi:hypothetical protein
MSLKIRTHGGITAPCSSVEELQPVAKRQRKTQPVTRPTDPTFVIAWPPQPHMLLTTEQLDGLGTYIVGDSLRLEDAGFEQLVNERRQRLDFHPKVKTLRHKAARLLNHLKERDASVIFSTPPWTHQQRTKTMRQGPHKSAVKYVNFLQEELLDFVKKGFWIASLTVCSRSISV